jgi:hypothetical protein
LNFNVIFSCESMYDSDRCWTVSSALPSCAVHRVDSIKPWFKSSHCLPPTQSLFFHFNSWACLLVLNLNGGFRRLLADNSAFVHAGILNASFPALEIFSLHCSLSTVNYIKVIKKKKKKKTATQPVSKSSKVWKTSCNIYQAELTVPVIHFYNSSITNSYL